MLSSIYLRQAVWAQLHACKNTHMHARINTEERIAYAQAHVHVACLPPCLLASGLRSSLTRSVPVSQPPSIHSSPLQGALCPSIPLFLSLACPPPTAPRPPASWPDVLEPASLCTRRHHCSLAAHPLAQLPSYTPTHQPFCPQAGPCIRQATKISSKQGNGLHTYVRAK